MRNPTPPAVSEARTGRRGRVSGTDCESAGSPRVAGLSEWRRLYHRLPKARQHKATTKEEDHENVIHPA
jgi:hypothetical protein